MKKIILVILLLLVPIKVNAYDLDLNIQSDQTLNFYFIVTDTISENNTGVFLEGITVELGDYAVLSNEQGIAKIENVPLKDCVLSIYDENGKLLYKKNVIIGFSNEENGWRYNSISHEDNNNIYLNLGYTIEDVTAGDIRMDVHINHYESKASISLITRTLGSKEGSSSLLMTITLGFSMILFMYLFERILDKK